MKSISKLIFTLIILTTVNTACDKSEDEKPEKDSKALIAYYPFNGNANDESDNNNSGTVIGASLTDDRFGNANSAYYLDGVNDYINAGDFIDINKSFSFSGWFKVATSADGWNPLFVKGTSCDFGVMYKNFIYYSGRLLRTFNGTCEGQIDNDLEITLTRNTWFHFVFTYDGETIKLFVDGYLLEEFPYSSAINDKGNLLLGATFNNDGQSHFWHGAIDDIRIYNYELTVDEIEDLRTEKY